RRSPSSHELFQSVLLLSREELIGLERLNDNESTAVRCREFRCHGIQGLAGSLPFCLKIADDSTMLGCDAIAFGQYRNRGHRLAFLELAQFPSIVSHWRFENHAYGDAVPSSIDFNGNPVTLPRVLRVAQTNHRAASPARG